MERRHYRTGEFARRAQVSVRCLRFYDQAGLLKPSGRTEAGYRLYTDEDLATLERILALKFLGLSLAEIKACLEAGPVRIEEALAQQKAMMLEKRRRLDAVLRALQETEELLRRGELDWSAVVRVIGAIQMEQSKEWVKKHFTEEQLAKMEELQRSSYSESARRKLSQRGEWTEEDQKRAGEQWAYVASESRRLAEAGADPGSEEAQAVAKLRCDLIAAFTQGDPEIEEGLNRFWRQLRELPEEERPFDAGPFATSSAATEFLDRAVAIYQERQAQQEG